MEPLQQENPEASQAEASQAEMARASSGQISAKPLLAWAWPVWIMRAAWLAVPFTTGEVLATALHSYASSFRTACAVGLWVLWGATALAAMTLRPFALGFVRIWMPAGLAAAVWAVAARSAATQSVAEERLGETILGLAIAAVAAAVSLMPSVGAAFTDQRVASRPNTSIERRLLLRPPAATAFALTPLAWAATIAGSISGPLLLAAERWVLGAVVLVVGLAVAFRGYQSLLILARRWVVFVPAGIVLHDPLTLGDEAILLPKSGIKSLQVVSASTRRQEAAEARKNEAATGGPTSPKADLSAGSLGTAIDLTLHEPARIPRLRQAPELATCVRFSPSSAHTFTEEALARSIVSGGRAYSGHGPAALAAEEIKGREKIPPNRDRP